jgi:quercetin dioxygenase-like cupin family protein
VTDPGAPRPSEPMMVLARIECRLARAAGRRRRVASTACYVAWLQRWCGGARRAAGTTGPAGQVAVSVRRGPSPFSSHYFDHTGSMQRTSLDALARELLTAAAVAPGGHSARTVCGGHEKVLRQTVIAMTEGSRLGEHENPGEATVLVLRGRVRLWTGEASWEARRGDLIIVPDSRHGLEAIEDATVLLTVAKSV